jgi:hypothetical protein
MVELVTYAWLEKAARLIKRRASAKGGDDRTFYEDICCLVDSDSKLRYQSERDLIKQIIWKSVLFNGECIEYWAHGRNEASGTLEILDSLCCIRQ